jgi:hypothetical protein
LVKVNESGADVNNDVGVVVVPPVPVEPVPLVEVPSLPPPPPQAVNATATTSPIAYFNKFIFNFL